MIRGVDEVVEEGRPGREPLDVVEDVNAEVGGA